MSHEKKIVTVEKGTEMFEIVKMQFLTSWTKGAAPNVVRIFKINSRRFKSKYEGYNARQSMIVEQDLWHGTRLGCHLARTRRLCRKDNCSICGIARTGFRLNRLATGALTSVNKFERFGAGLYFAPNASKSNDYTTENANCADHACGCRGSRAMILCHVSSGRAYVARENMPHLHEPPRGYDSVMGITGTALMYPEVIVYDEAAVIPRYIVVFH